MERRRAERLLHHENSNTYHDGEIQAEYCPQTTNSVIFVFFFFQNQKETTLASSPESLSDSLPSEVIPTS
ncbi:MAG: hypothetical protein Q8789_02475, partial [Sweet potato little leaf phytoplasma]|nr:hypothetical protein [Sweet potato little leaf phytoplasma]